MISSVEKLKRAFELDPSNESLKQQLVQALFREDRKAEARELVKGHFRCPLQWDELSETESQGTKDCDQCQKQVHFAWTLPDMHDLVEKDHCIAAPQHLVDDYADAVAEKLWSRPKEKSAQCVFQSELPIIEDLEAVANNEVLFETLFNGLTSQFRIAPIRIADGILEVASDVPIPQDVLEQLQDSFPNVDSVKQYLASPEQLTSVINKFVYLINDMFMGDICVIEEPPEFDDPEFEDLEDPENGDD